MQTLPERGAFTMMQVYGNSTPYSTEQLFIQLLMFVFLLATPGIIAYVYYLIRYRKRGIRNEDWYSFP